MRKEFFNGIEKDTYTQRMADRNWMELIRNHVKVENKRAADIGTGGGIYAMALADLGAESVIGIDISENMLKAAKQNCRDYHNIRFQSGNSSDSNLPDQSVDVLLERALIHHLRRPELGECFKEAARVLADQGVFIVQDRTVEDCGLPGSQEHIRGYFFEVFPELLEKDMARRHSVETVQSLLAEAGFDSVQVVSFWEHRKIYDSVKELQEEIISRKGRSILFELNDEQVHDLAERIAKRVQQPFPLVEKERWTIWFAQK